MGRSDRAGVEGSVSLRVREEQMACFFPLLQKGFAMPARLGRSVGVFLREQLGLSGEYIETRIQTVFLDGKPVDDIERALLGEGTTLALAPAMPGLMGAMLRRGGYYAPMRSGITHRDDVSPQQATGKGLITLKLFGTALRELGPGILARGIGVDGEALAQLLEGLPEECRGELGGAAAIRGGKTVLLRVEVMPAGGRDPG